MTGGDTVSGTGPQEAPGRRTRGKSMDAAPAEPGDGLLLWMLSAGHEAEAQARSALGLSTAKARLLCIEAGARFERVRRLRSLGALMTRAELSLLLRARLAEQLLSAQGASEFAALLRVIDKVPALDDGAQEAGGAGACNDVSGLDLAAAVTEAKLLLAEIEAEATGGVTAPVPTGEQQ